MRGVGSTSVTETRGARLGVTLNIPATNTAGRSAMVSLYLENLVKTLS